MLADSNTLDDNRAMTRERTLKELEKRYREAVASTQQEITTPLQYEQMLTVIAHFMRFISEKKLLKKAVGKIQKAHTKVKEVLDEDEKKLLELLESESKKLTKIAKRKKVLTEIPTSQVGSVPQDQKFAFALNSVNEFLAKEEKHMSEIPRHLGNLRVMVWALKDQGVSNRTLKPFEDPYTPLQNDFSKKVKLGDLYRDYLRLDDYMILEDVRKFIYQDMPDVNDQIVFLIVDNDDLIDYSHTKKYDARELLAAKQRQTEYYGNVLRLYNYLTDELENVPFITRVWNWMFMNFGPTFVSVLLILGIYLLALAIGVPIDPDKVTGWLIR
jgi:hypothetical protein